MDLDTFNILPEEIERKKMIHTYKGNMVGSFAGPWDRSITDDLTLGVTTLNYDEYSKYQHEPKNEHFDLKIDREMYDSLETHEKIDAF